MRRVRAGRRVRRADLPRAAASELEPAPLAPPFPPAHAAVSSPVATLPAPSNFTPKPSPSPPCPDVASPTIAAAVRAAPAAFTPHFTWNPTGALSSAFWPQLPAAPTCSRLHWRWLWATQKAPAQFRRVDRAHVSWPQLADGGRVEFQPEQLAHVLCPCESGAVSAPLQQINAHAFITYIEKCILACTLDLAVQVSSSCTSFPPVRPGLALSMVNCIVAAAFERAVDWIG